MFDDRSLASVSGAWGLPDSPMQFSHILFGAVRLTTVLPQKPMTYVGAIRNLRDNRYFSHINNIAVTLLEPFNPETAHPKRGGRGGRLKVSLAFTYSLGPPETV